MRIYNYSPLRFEDRSLMKSEPLRAILAITALWQALLAGLRKTKTRQNSDLAAANQLYQAGKFS
jgi:hypothetical protein